MKLFKKLSMYFFTAVFFVGLLPKKCDNNWPYPGDDGPKITVNIDQQEIINTPVTELEITNEIA